MTVDVVVQSIIDENFIERRPIFSEDGNNIYVIDRDCVKEFSVQTSECCCTFFQDGESLRTTHSNIVGIAFHENYLYACTSNLTFLKWSRKGELILTAKRECYPKCKPFDLTIVDYDHGSGNISQPQLFAFVRDKSQQKVQIQTFSLNFQRKKSFVYRGVPDPKLIALGCVDDRHFVATALGRELLVYDLEDSTKPAFKFSNSVSDWAVVRTVPHVDSIAAGDKKGRVVLYQHIFEETRKRKHNDRRSFVAAALYHWHAHPVNDIAFSPTGTQMYTGSEEMVLVRWNVRNPSIREYAPRLQSSIQHIVVSPCNTTVSVSLVDNALALVSAQMQLHHIIQKLTWYLEPADPSQHNILPARMCYDPNSRCVVMNGRHGHLQFISLARQELAYSMDICECNYMREPEVQLQLMQVMRVAVSQDGRWMATVEMRDDRQTAREVLMKMWQYDDTQRRFVMNTCINLPHYDYAVTAMRFQPTRSLAGEKRSSTMLVTSGEDKKFRVWTSGKMLVGSRGEYTTTWTNDRVGFYRDKEGGAVAFSYDGSVLAVGFGASLTVWDSDTVEMSASLTRGPEPINFIEFEQKPYSHMVVTASTSTLQVWDLLSLSVVWCVKLNVTALTADPLSEHFAAFTADNQLFVFKTEQRMPVVKMAATNKMAAATNNKMAAAEDGGEQRPSPPPVMAAIFVPRGGEDEGKDSAEEEEGRLPSWMEKSKLYYVTQSQELLAIDVKSSTSSWQTLPAVSLDDSGQALRGPYALLTAKKVRQESMDEDFVEDINQRMGNLVEQSTRKLLSIPIHAVPHISLLCEDFLACQLSAKHEFPDSSRLQEMETEVEEKMAEKTKKKKKKKKRKEITNENVNEIIDEVALENLFSIDTSPGADLNMDLE